MINKSSSNPLWSGKRIAIVGYGVEGQSSARYFARHGASIAIHDAKSIDSFAPSLLKEAQALGAELHLGAQAFEGLIDYDLVMRTPTFPPYHPKLQMVSPAKLSSQTKVFLQQWGHRTVGITGTKGKGTTASLLHHMLRASNKKTVLGGNIGVPLLDLIDEMTEEHIAIAELSSFQLWDTTISPHWAILLMIAPEHLEQHGSLDDYLAAKQHLLLFQSRQDISVILSDYHLTHHISNQLPSRQWRVTSRWIERGAKLEGEIAHIITDNHDFEVRLDATSLRGQHNTANLAAAALMAAILGAQPQDILASLPSYQPLPHRLQKVTTVDNVSFYDDSIATTPEATVAGIKSFTEPLVAILGGINHGANWSDVADALRSGATYGCVLMGEEAPRIKQALERLPEPPPSIIAASYAEAIKWGTQQLPTDQHGVILLSPGAKSFDQFIDYKDRGARYQIAIRDYEKGMLSKN
jgi:UDP-N-acetylmuramoylalanine--D-glutamate ligase